MGREMSLRKGETMGHLGVAGKETRGTPQCLLQGSLWLSAGLYLHGGALSMPGEGREGL